MQWLLVARAILGGIAAIAPISNSPAGMSTISPGLTTQFVVVGVGVLVVVGKRAKWISLVEFADLMERAISFEPNYQEFATHKPISQYQDSFEAAGI